jgi:hypothetical protein
MMAVPASAATFRITLDPFASGPISVGTFEADVGGGPVTSANLNFNSITYNKVISPISSVVNPTYDGTMKLIFGGIFSAGSPSTLNYLFFTKLGSTGFYFDLNCPIGEGACGEDPVGNFTVEQVSAVPVPAALPLLASCLGALGLIGWRRKNRKAA